MAEPGPLTPEDRLMIMDLYARYAWSMDSGNLDDFVGCFPPNATLYWGGTARGHAEIRRMEEHFFTTDSAFPGAQHFATQFRIEGNAERANTRAYVARLHRIPGTTNSSVIWQGYYTDVCVKVNGRWFYETKKAHTAEELRKHHFGNEPRWIPPQFYDGAQEGGPSTMVGKVTAPAGSSGKNER